MSWKWRRCKGADGGEVDECSSSSSSWKYRATMTAGISGWRSGISSVSTTGLVGTCVLLIVSAQLLNAQSEGDTGYDYNDAYADSYDDESVPGIEPAFDVLSINDVTVNVVAGQTALLHCSIEYIGNYKVAWLDQQRNPLTYDDQRVVNDRRFSVVRTKVNEWNLQIRDTKCEDQGQYRCIINTNPVKNKIVTLHVKVPASIIDELSSNDTTAQEGDVDVRACNVTEFPYRRPVTPGRSEERETSTIRNSGSDRLSFPDSLRSNVLLLLMTLLSLILSKLLTSVVPSTLNSHELVRRADGV